VPAENIGEWTPADTSAEPSSMTDPGGMYCRPRLEGHRRFVLKESLSPASFTDGKSQRNLPYNLHSFYSSGSGKSQLLLGLILFPKIPGFGPLVPDSNKAFENATYRQINARAIFY